MMANILDRDFSNTCVQGHRSKTIESWRTKVSEKLTVELGNVQKTLFLPLWGRAIESTKEKPLLVDKTALQIIEAVDYDFSTIAHNISPLTQAAWIMRSRCVDEIVRAFLAKYSRATIVNVGCGLDTTYD